MVGNLIFKAGVAILLAPLFLGVFSIPEATTIGSVTIWLGVMMMIFKL